MFPGITCPLSKPQMLPDEDKASFECHNNALVHVFRKSNPNMTIVTSFMDVSFAMRWGGIHGNLNVIDFSFFKFVLNIISN